MTNHSASFPIFYLSLLASPNGLFGLSSHEEV